MNQQEFSEPIARVLRMYERAIDNAMCDMREAFADHPEIISDMGNNMQRDKDTIREFVHSLEEETGWTILQEAAHVN